MQLITKFNKLIRNKFIWGAFAFIICFVFVLAGVSTRGCGDGAGAGASGVEGMIGGAEITSAEFGRALYFESIGRDTPEDANARRELRRRTWIRLAALKEAKDLGIVVPETTLIQIIQQQPSFQIEGQFSYPLYEETLRRQGMRPKDFEAYLRQDITMRTLAGVLESAVWTPPDEIQETLSGLTDLFTLEYVVLTENKFAKDVKADDTQVEAYYESNRTVFEVPEKVRVKYVSFPVSNYLANASSLVDAVDVGLFYTNNLEQYTFTDTNDVETIRPFEEVQSEIREQLERNEAQFIAKDRALDFASLLLPSRYHETVSMEEAARRENLAVSTSAYFTASEYVSGVDAGFDFTKSAFELDADSPEDAISDAIVGADHVYIAEALDRQPAFIPRFEEVKERAAELATELERRKALMEKAEDIHNEVEDTIVEGTPFSQAVADYPLNVITTQPFTVYGGIQEEIPGGHDAAAGSDPPNGG